MIKGALGTVGYSHSAPLLYQPNAGTCYITPLVGDFTLNEADIAEVSATITGQATYNWIFTLWVGDGTWLSASSGEVYTTVQNTYTFKALLRANTAGLFRINCDLNRPSNAPVTDGLLLVKVIARDA